MGNWYIGQKVRCIDDRFHEGVWEFCIAVPCVGHIYTIRGIQVGTDAYTHDGGLGLLLEEIVNPKYANGREVGFFTYRFRPLSASGHFAESAAHEELVSSSATPRISPHMEPLVFPVDIAPGHMRRFSDSDPGVGEEANKIRGIF